jgi:hypothetical protein
MIGVPENAIDRDSEISQSSPRSRVLRAVIDQHDVRWRDVAVNYATSVDIFEHLGDLQAHLADLSGREDTAFRRLAKGESANKFHNEEWSRITRRPRVDARVDDRDDSVVAETGEQSKFLLLLADLGFAAGVEQFDRYVASEYFVPAAKGCGRTAARHNSRWTVSGQEQRGIDNPSA